MNFKKTTLVLAMAGIVAAPMVVQADSEVYASLRIGIQDRDVSTAGVTNQATTRTKIGNVSSRFGVKSESDLGNGMTGFGRFEWSAVTEGSAATANTSPFGLRHAFVGLKGDFGKVTIGQTWHTFFNHTVAPTDIPWVGSYVAMLAYVGRQESGISYAGSAGAVSYGASLIMDDSSVAANGDQETLDQIQLGLSFDAGFGTFGIAMLDQDGVGAADPDALLGLTLHSVAAGPVTLAFTYQQQDVGTTSPSSILLSAQMAGAYLQIESLDADAPAAAAGAGDADSMAIGYTMGLGPQTSAWFEYNTGSVDNGANDTDTDQIFAMLKYDI